jgi:glycosyltransferase involved in cell wall biosynthesis
MTMPFFSVVIPTFNRAPFIKATVQSVLDQQFSDFEIILVDDGSTDKTREILLDLPDTRIVYLKKENGERGAARNAGVRVSKGAYITFLDSDDRFYVDHLAEAHRFILNNDHPSVFHQGYVIKDEFGKTIAARGNLKDINRTIVEGNDLSCAGVFVKRDVMLNNLFNEDRGLASLEDWELWIRMASRNLFLTNNLITSCMLYHDRRSVIQIDELKLKRAADLFIKYVSEDSVNHKVYGHALRQAYGGVLTYVSLHLAIARCSKKEALRYLFRGLKKNPRELFKRRFFVILKLLILK